MKALYLFLCLLLCHCRTPQTANLNWDPEEIDLPTATPPDVVMSFVGKAALFPWDIGVTSALLDNSLKGKSISIVGSSSGAVITSFFACHGINQHSLQQAKNHFNNFFEKHYDLIQPSSDRGKLIMKGKQTENADGILALENFMYEMLGEGECDQKLPMLIVAANVELLDDSLPFQKAEIEEWEEEDLAIKLTRPKDYRAGRRSKTLDYENFDLFKCDEPDQECRPKEKLGKACTFFINEQMLALMHKIPKEERRCDWRLVKNKIDLIFAVLSSVSEPTYFFPQKEAEPEKIIWQAKEGNTDERYYGGGFLMLYPGRNLKRLFPHAYFIATGSLGSNAIVNAVLKKWYNLDLYKNLSLDRWWVDADIPPPWPLWNRSDYYPVKIPASPDELGKVISVDELFTAGQAAAQKCFEDKSKCTYSDNELIVPEKESRGPAVIKPSTGISAFDPYLDISKLRMRGLPQ